MKTIKSASLCVLFIFFIFISHNALSAVDVSKISYPYNLINDIDYYEDTTGELDYYSLKHKGFKKAKKGIENLNFGYSQSSYWIRFYITSSENNINILELGYPLIDYVTIYILDVKANKLEVFRTGDLLPYRYREIEYNNILKKIKIRKNQKIEFIINVKSGGSLHVPLHLWNDTSLLEHEHTERFLYGIYIGIMISMVLYNLFIFFTVRDISYFYYVSYILFYLLVQLSLNGTTLEYVFRDQSKYSDQALIIFLCSGFTFMALFSKKIFKLRRIFKKYYKHPHCRNIDCFNHKLFRSLLAGYPNLCLDHCSCILFNAFVRSIITEEI